MAAPVQGAPPPAGGAVQQVPTAGLAVPAAAAVLAPTRLGFRLVELENALPTGRVLELPDTAWEGTLYLGRPDLSAGVVVDVDLSAIGGYEKRVSRKQSRLHYVALPGGGPNQIRLEDWASGNGTWLNKVKLAAGASEALQAGDEVRFAEMTFRVAFENP